MQKFNEETLEYDKIRLLLSRCSFSPLGQKLAEKLLPFQKHTSLIDELNVVSKMRVLRQEGLRLEFESFRKIDSSTLEFRSEKPVLEGLELYFLSAAVRECSAYQQLIETAAEENKELEPVVRSLDAPEWIADEVAKAIDNEGNILDEASPELSNLKKSLRKARKSINEVLSRFFDETDFPGYVQDDFITIRGGRMVIPIKIEHRNKHKGIVHDRSRAGAGDSLFFEPLEVVELNNSLASIQREIKIEEARILAKLTASFYSYWDEVCDAFRAMARLDFLMAKAEFANLSDSVNPEITFDGGMKILGARHPLLDERLEALRAQCGLQFLEDGNHPVVPVDIELGEKWSVLVVTGPNAGGKTVSLKTAGLLSLMAMSGLHVPAKQFMAPMFNMVSADIGDAQNIITHQSSFSSHLIWLKETMDNLRKPALLLIDEIAAATDPGEGSALAMATLESLRDEGVFVMVSTHLEALKAFAHAQEDMENCCVEFDPGTLRPTFRLSYGLPGKSNALETAAEMGLPEQILKRAHYFMGDEGAKSSEIIGKLQEELTRLQKVREDSEMKQKELEKAREHYVGKLDKVEERTQSEIASIKKEWKEYKRVHDGKIREAIEAAKQEQNVQQARAVLVETSHERDEQFEKLKLHRKARSKPVDDSGPLKSGDRVELIGLGQFGTVQKDWNKKDGPNVALDVSGKRLSIPRGAVRKVADQDKKRTGSGKISVKASTAAVRTELNLIGKKVEEALHEAEKFFDDALLNNLATVRIIHGRGTGALKNAIEQHLKQQEFVESWHSAKPLEGGEAVTVVDLVR